MHAAWLLFCAFLAAYTALLAVRRPARQGKSLFPIAAVACAAALFAARSYAWYASSYSRAEDATRLRSTLPQVGRPGGYVSSEKCRACHPDEYASWHATFHRTMTQFVSRETVLAPFNGEQLELEGQKFRLESRGDEFSIEMEDPEWHIEALAARSSKDRAPPTGRPERLTKRVGMVTGRHNMQVFWVPSRKGNSQISFPFTWIVAERRWAPLLSTFLRDPKAPFIYHTWNTSCIQCHTTNGQPLPGPEGSLATRTGEIGIGCECCHGPGDEHVRANQLPVRRYLLHESAQGGDSTIVNPKKLPGKLSSQVCGQCHGIKWIDNLEDWRQNGWRFRPGEELASSTPIIRATDLDDVARHLRVNVKLTELPRNFFFENSYWSDGMVRVSGRDYSGLVESACYQKGDLSCLHCHSMHQSAPVDQLSSGSGTNEACYSCHAAHRERLEAHTHHAAASSGSLCYNCHMPHTAYGLLKAIRSHWIDSPSISAELRTGRPNACSLCHLDKPLAWAADQLAAWTEKPAPALSEEQRSTAAGVLWLLRGDAGLRALAAWHAGWPDARQACGSTWLAPFLAVLLDDPYSAVRFISRRSLRSLPGFENFSYDFEGPAEERAAARRRATEQWASAGAQPDRSGTHVLIRPDGSVETERLERLLQQRNDRSMDLQE